MKKILRIIFVALLLGGWGLAASALHVVRTPQRLVVVPKDTLGITDTYVDTRGWTLNDAAAHGTVVKRLMSAGKAHAFDHLSDLKKDADVEAQLTEAIRRGPTTKPATQPVMLSLVRK